MTLTFRVIYCFPSDGDGREYSRFFDVTEEQMNYESVFMALMARDGYKPSDWYVIEVIRLN